MAKRAPGSIAAALPGLAPTWVHVGRNWTKADVSAYTLPVGKVAVKSYAARPFWIRWTLGLWLLRRECAAYRAAAAGGVAGLPEFLGCVGSHAFATRWIEARPLSSFRGRKVPAAVFDRLRSILDALHGAGIALGDLHHRDVLLSEDGAVHVVDLTTAVRRGARGNPLRRWVFRRFREIDDVAYLRLRARYLEEREADLELEAAKKALSWHTRGRQVKRFLDRLRGRTR